MSNQQFYLNYRHSLKNFLIEYQILLAESKKEDMPMDDFLGKVDSINAKLLNATDLLRDQAKMEKS
ncbi:hypothetical protein [Pseudobacteriovorax antillogorgiicola]|nr:hypothetical protein [Pseudobacteriovorax antillogorgiicola]